MKYFIVLLLCLTTQLFAQESLTRSFIPDTVYKYITIPCPDVPITAAKKNVQKQIPIPQVCSTPITITLAQMPHVPDTIVVNNFVNVNVITEPTIGLSTFNKVEEHNTNVRKGNAKIVSGTVGFGLAAAGFIIGASRHYNLSTLNDYNVIEYKDHNIRDYTNINNIIDEIREQDRIKQMWFIGSGIIAGIATTCLISGIVDNTRNKIVITPTGFNFKYTFKYKRR